MDPIYQNITANKRWTYLFFTFYAIIIGMMGYALGLYINSVSIGLTVAFIIIVFLLFFSYYQGQNVIKAMSGSHEISKLEEPYLYNTVESLSIAAGLPMPKLYLIDTDVPNAFASGRNPENASITVTLGLIERLDRLELEGVIAHEMAHIKNYDVLLATVAIVLAGTIVFVGYITRYSTFGLIRGGSRSGPAGIIFIILFIAFIFLTPLFAQLLKFAISRKREFLADATGADLTGYPEGLASALEKISSMQKSKSKIQNNALNNIYIINPAIANNNESRFFSTHPPTEERVRRLREMEFIDQKPDTNLNYDKTDYKEETIPNINKDVNLGYLVCDKCNGYYKLQKGENPEDFTDKCECGGKLRYRDSL